MISTLKKKIQKIVLRFYSIEKQARLLGVQMGEGNFIGSRFWDTDPYLVSIGNNCAITNGVRIFTHGGARAARFRYPKFDCFGKVFIGDYVYIGANSLIMPGVTIGNNVLVAAGSIITNSVPSNTVVGGNPAKILCTIDEYIVRNLPYNLDSKGMSAKEKKNLLLSLSPDSFIKKKEMKFPDNSNYKKL